MLSINQDPRNALFLGYSATRLGIVLLTVICGIACLFLARHIFINGVPDPFQKLVSEKFDAVRFISITLFLFGVIIWLVPSAYLGKYSEYFERVLPLLIVLAILPFQLIIPKLFVFNRETAREMFRASWIAGSMLAILFGFIALTRLGVEPDTHFWNVAGVPLTALQLTVILFITIICFYAIRRISAFPRVSSLAIDIGIAVLLYIASIWIWTQTPMVKQFYALRPGPPAFQYFPYSDALMHDLGALSILNGYGINFGEYTDKPIYMVFLAILHLFTGNDYNQLSLIHLACMAFIIPALFWFGKNFHGRHFGIVLALIILVRQRNAILLAHLLAGTNPRLLMTEIPTLLGLIVLCNLLFFWLEKNSLDRASWKYALLVGAILGAISLMRLNPIGLLPVISLTIMLALRKLDDKWPVQVIVFALGFFMVFTPWLITGRNANGEPYLWTKIINIITVRYPGIPALEEGNRSTLNTNMKFQPQDFSGVANDDRVIPMGEFPMFVINHSLHNMVAAFLALPDSPFSNDQDLRNLIKRPYLDEKQIAIWNGSLQAGQISFIILNVFLLAIGLGWSWKRWKWLGIFPAMIFVTYVITLGFARSSGSRYIVPIDWIVFFYYILGIILIIEQFSTVFAGSTQDKYSETAGSARAASPAYTISIVLFLSLLVPIFQIPVITKNLPSCNSQVIDPAYEQFELVKGEVLYPYLEKDSFHFMFFVCGQRNEMNVPDFNAPLQHGQTIVIGFSKEIPTQLDIILVEENSSMVPLWSRQ